ncbi:hypothetical protein [Alicyclobacillus dauci]|uniref:Uncharacterized protein n=1 Tax=Alicyclobacillus dauci TaxID=1475485 RepID=A0ABY6Z2W2_9BACL|nr:hypothetical protein [Alicyclobacillus dauci]WAH36536.1 hypothetical protein NZD86_20380 [Alicyclobacillus dauci]
MFPNDPRNGLNPRDLERKANDKYHLENDEHQQSPLQRPVVGWMTMGIIALVVIAVIVAFAV